MVTRRSKYFLFYGEHEEISTEVRRRWRLDKGLAARRAGALSAVCDARDHKNPRVALVSQILGLVGLLLIGFG
ncbi:hypothetical protein ES319_A03G159500v1 [Gossypium barbadense]|uniref:Uncharacterized protein n=1 Tax=Gossypium barbadense TaxID=3634 RepID=A0A5J5WE42_GOSBA|nr:hypothetical protein ES319_A03G159500v1 [Gossypium barbadense]